MRESVADASLPARARESASFAVPFMPPQKKPIDVTGALLIPRSGVFAPIMC